MSDETTLLPCPFCGGEAAVKTDRRWPDGCGDSPVEAYEAVCQNMDCIIYGADSAYYLTEAEAIAAWNTRAEHVTLTAEQVREAAELHSREYQSPTDPYVYLTEYDWQAIADELSSGRLSVHIWCDTPEQAIAATLGNERELIDLAHNAWSMALCAMQGMPIPAEWGDAVERGLREHGIDVDEELAGFEEVDE